MKSSFMQESQSKPLYLQQQASKQTACHLQHVSAMQMQQ
jgi:hypothetical protein